MSTVCVHPRFRWGCSPEQVRGCKSCGSLGGEVLMYEEAQRALLGTKNGYGLCLSGSKVDFESRSGAAMFILGLGSQFVVLPHQKKSHFSARLDRRHSLRSTNFGHWGWRREFCRGTEERSSTKFKSVDVPANYLSNPQKQGGHPGNSKHEVRGQGDDSTAVTLAGCGFVLSPEVRGAKVKVVAAGAGAAAILNFCQQSSLLPTAQFWYSSDVASEPVLLSDSQLPASARNGFDEGNRDLVITQESNEEIVFLVLGVGSGIGLGTIPEQLKAVRSRGCLTVGIFIQPFSFEGAKRQEQANQLIDGLLGCTDILLVVEQDGLLRRDIVTVSEASTLAKNAVLLSIKTISELLTGKAMATLDTRSEGNGAVPDDAMKILQHAGQAWLGSGRGSTVKEAVEMAVAEAPISDYRPFGAKRLVLCTVASAVDQSREEVAAWKASLHQTLGPDLQLLASIVKNPALENNVKLATIIIARVHTHQVTTEFSDKKGDENGAPSIIASNAVDDTVGPRQNLHSSLSPSINSSVSPVESPQDKAPPLLPGGAARAPESETNDNGASSVNQTKSAGGTKVLRPSNEWTSPPQKPKPTPPPQRSPAKRPSGYTYRTPIREEVKSTDRQVASQASLATSAASQKLRLAWEAGPSSDIAEAWAQARADAREPTQVTSALDVSLPIGVRLGAQQSQRLAGETLASSAGIEVAEDKWSGTDAVPVDPDALPRNRMVDRGLEAVRDMYNAASALVMGKDGTDDRRQASLSQRAASMLESERSQKKLTPLVEMGFKNGSYKGRCLGGLPEGKGRLSFSDGSFYDGQWRQGKRAGSGGFYYSNGDMFQGSWKDDVMHGKGWMYYHNGDRLYANFWKGRADGEGRFYSAQGDVFFGQFRENWRHGEFLYIEASGVRWSEIWGNGVLQSRTPADDA